MKLNNNNKDITSPEDIEHLIRAFYSDILKDEVIGYIFTDVAKLDLESHFPKLFMFWENILLRPNGYQTNVMQVHLDLNLKVKLKKEHFDRWLSLFNNTVDACFEGEVAEKAKVRAFSIAVAMQAKIFQQDNNLLH